MKEEDKKDVKKDVKKEVRKAPTPSGLYQKPLRKKGGAIGTRELSTGKVFETTLNIPKAKAGEIRTLVFGGVSEIGKNMYAIEYNDEILILDCGMKFSEADTPGIDFVLPNIRYLEERKDKIKAIIISHGHLDHIGGISVIAPMIGNPPIYTRRLTAELIRKRNREYDNKNLLIREVEKNDVLELSENLIIHFFSVTHTIPDALGAIIQTPTGCITFTGDLKLKHVDGNVEDEEIEQFKIFKGKKILLTLADSTNADRPGFSIPEARVLDTIGKIIHETKGRVVLSSFSSQIDRNIEIIEQALKSGRKVVVQGRSMLENLLIASDLGLLKVPMSSIIPAEKMADHPKEKILALVTGAQGDEFSALDRASRETHRYLRLDKHDTIVFSSSIVPGNEEKVQNLKDRLSRLGVNIITYQTSDVHSSGHANGDELKWIHEHINAKFFIPIHGYHYMLRAHGNILQRIGVPEENIALADNGSIIDITADGERIKVQDYTMPTELMVVDGNAVGEVQHVVLNDRKILRKEGIFVVIILISKNTRRLKKSPDILSRGFVYLRESQGLINKVRHTIRNAVERDIQNSAVINIDKIKGLIVRETQDVLYYSTKKRPIIIPVIFIV